MTTIESSCLLDLHPQRHLLDELAGGPVDLDAPGRDRDGDAGGIGMGCFPIRLMRVYQTKQITSPPTPFSSAVRLVMTPLDVDMIATPMPPSTRGRRSLRA